MLKNNKLTPDFLLQGNDAHVDYIDGMLVIYFNYKQKKEGLHRNVQVVLNNDETSLTLTALAAKFKYVYDECRLFDNDGHTFNLNNIKPEYILSKTIKSFFGKPKDVKYIKQGWVEMNKTDFPINIITTNFRIII